MKVGFAHPRGTRGSLTMNEQNSGEHQKGDKWMCIAHPLQKGSFLAFDASPHSDVFFHGHHWVDSRPSRSSRLPYSRGSNMLDMWSCAQPFWRRPGGRIGLVGVEGMLRKSSTVSIDLYVRM